MIKLDCIIIYIDLDTIEKARNELDGACAYLVFDINL